jgi:hypothetical protein
VRHALYSEIGSAFNPVNGNYGVADHDPGRLENVFDDYQLRLAATLCYEHQRTKIKSALGFERPNQ